MELNQLVFFKEIASTGNMSQAAKNLYVSQPALSQSIKKLESELRTTLFDRGKEKMSLTDDGKALLTHVDIILDEIKLIKTALFSGTQKRASLSLSSDDEASLRYFGATIAAAFQDLTIMTSLRSPKELVRDLLRGATDIIFTDNPIDDKDIFTTYICSATVTISIPPGHRLYNCKVISWKDLDSESILIPEGNSYYLMNVARIESMQKIQINRIRQHDYSLFINLAQSTPLLHFDSTIDRLFQRNPMRRVVALVNPGVNIKYYASCRQDYTSEILPFVTAIQKSYWPFEQFPD